MEDRSNGKKKRKSLQRVEESQAEAKCKAAQMSLPNRHPAIAHGNVSHNVHICFQLETSLAFLYNHAFLIFKLIINLLHIISLCGTVKTKLNVFPLTAAFWKALRTLKSSNYCGYCRFIVSEGKVNTQTLSRHSQSVFQFIPGIKEHFYRKSGRKTTNIWTTSH